MEFVKSRILSADDRDLTIWRLVTETPEVSQMWAAIILVLNIVVPGIYQFESLYLGLGTMVLSFYYDRCSKTTFVVGLF